MSFPRLPCLLLLALTLCSCDSKDVEISKDGSPFHIDRNGVTAKEWLEVRAFAKSKGYDLPDIGKASDELVRGISWFEAVRWCNAKSEMEGNKPVYYTGGEVYRTGERLPEMDVAANGHRLPTIAEWEFAAQKASSTGLLNMTGTSGEWCWDPDGDKRRVGGGRNIAEAPSDRSANPGFRTAKNGEGAVVRQIALSSQWNFDGLKPGERAKGILTIKNPGSERLNVTRISYPAGFSGEAGPFAIEPSAEKSVPVVFAPSAAGKFVGAVVVSSDATQGNTGIPVSGVSIEPLGVLELSGDLDFGAVAVGESSARTLLLRNTGNHPLHVSGITLPTGFRGTCSGTIEPGGERRVRVTFSPTAPETHSGRMAIDLTSGTGMTSLPVGGTGTPPPPAPLGMTTVQAGTLPDSSALAGETIGTFHINTYEVTWGEWQAVRSFAVANGYDLEKAGAGRDANHPVRNVTWHDALKWCNAKSQMEGLEPVYSLDGGIYKAGTGIPAVDTNAGGYRLPTEAEWEWAARGGVESRGFAFSGSEDLNTVAWNWENALGAGEDLSDGRGTGPVGAKTSNEIGLHDLSGNVAEWCWNAAEGDSRRLRGGGWFGAVADCEVAARSFSGAGLGYDFIGFRTARNRVSSDTTAMAGQSPPPPAPAFTTEPALPDAQVGIAYRALIAVEGGSAPYRLRLKPGTTLPVGLVFSEGQIRGTPSTAGSQAFTILATDSANPVENTIARDFSLRVTPYGLEIEPDPATISAKFDEPLLVGFVPKGGKEPYRWSVVGTLPKGLSLSSTNGELSGKPRAVGNPTLTIRVRDANGFTAMRPVPLSITANPLEIVAPTSPAATAGLDFTWPITIKGGVPPYTLKPAVESELPSGLTLDLEGSSGRISGKPTTEGDFSFALEVADSRNEKAELQLALPVSAYDLAIAGRAAGPLAGKYNEPLDAQLAATGGKPPYIWNAIGDLPRGITLGSKTGAFSGNPTSLGRFPLILKVTDANKISATTNATILITADPVQIAAEPPPTATAGLDFSWTLAIQGGVPPYTLQPATESTLPAGLTLSLRGSTARLSGKPEAAGRFAFTVEAADSRDEKASVTLALPVIAYDLAIAGSAAGPLAGKYNEPLDAQLTATGGKPPYIWNAVGDLPRGVTLGSKTGTLGGTPVVAGSFPVVLEVTDANKISATTNATILITADPVQIAAEPAPTATAGLDFSWPITIQGGVPPHTLQLATGSTLPAGLTLSLRGSTARLSGKPAADGNFSFVLEAADSRDEKASLPLSLTVDSYSLAIDDVPLAGTYGQPLSTILTASGGKPPYTWSATGTLPQGIRLNRQSGMLAGTPTTIGEFPVLLKVTDANAVSAEKNTSVSITAVPLKILTTGLPPAKKGVVYNQRIETSGGVPSVTFLVEPGSQLPDGLSLTADSLLGTPGLTGVYSFGIAATDGAGTTVTQKFALTVRDYGMSVTGPATAEARENAPFAANFSAEGGEPPYAWSMTGAVPTGLSMNPLNGVLGGKPAKGTSGDRRIQIQVTDAAGITATKTVNIAITPSPDPASAGMVFVQGGNLPSTSPLGTKPVESFLIGRNEVTWGEWKKVRAQAAAMGYDIGDVGEGISDSHPVGSANWFDAVKWCNLRAEIEGLTPVYRVEGSVYKTGDSIPDITPGADGYRLPTELEWEWAARGGTSSKGYAYSGGNDLDAVAWHAGNNPSAQTRPVGTKAPNELGLTDMSGNVREWCWDADKSYRRFRGGGINDDTFNCNVAGIDFNYPNRRTEDCGLRLVRKASN